MNAGFAALQRTGRLRRVDLALGDWIARAFPDASNEVALAAALAARAVVDGHSALALDQAQAWFDGLEGESKSVSLPNTESWHEALQRSPAVHAHAAGTAAGLTPLILDPQKRIYLRRYFDYETRLAQALIARARAGDAGSEATDPEISVAGLDAEQLRAVSASLMRRFTLVTGGPGTGKTHSVVRMLAALAERAHARGESLRIALAAPTGKAAARLAEAVRAQRARLELAAEVEARIPDMASTLHGLIGLSPWHAKPRFDRATPLPFDVVVVDEVSMVDLPLMTKLVDAVPESAHLILLGDPGQLAAVEAGNVLGALVEAATNGPLRDCHVALTRSHRFSADSAIGALSGAIARGDAETASRVLANGGHVSLVADAPVRHVVDAATAAYRRVVEANTPGEALHAARGFRVLTALRRGPSGCVAIDQAIAQRLQRMAGARGDEAWWRGRLALVTANRPELGLFNGDTGVAWPDAEGNPKVWFEGARDAPRAFAPSALPPHEGGFALTVHKAQGSEFERVALVTGPDSSALTRELLYTGVTRARVDVTIYSTPETLRAGIERRTLRFTGLADRLREAAQAAGT